MTEPETTSRSYIDSLDPKVKQAFLKEMPTDTYPYGDAPADDIMDAIDDIVDIFGYYKAIDTVSDPALAKLLKVFLNELLHSPSLKMMVAAWDEQTYEKYFPGDKYRYRYLRGHRKLARTIEELIPAVNDVPSVAFLDLENLPGITSAIVQGVKLAGEDMRERAGVRALMIEALVGTWKGTNVSGVVVIERELKNYYSDFPSMKDTLSSTACYLKLLTCYEPNAARVVKHWGNEFLTETMSDVELITLIKTNLVPRLVLMNVARLDTTPAVPPAVHAEYLRVMKKYNCHDNFYQVSTI